MLSLVAAPQGAPRVHTGLYRATLTRGDNMLKRTLLYIRTATLFLAFATTLVAVMVAYKSPGFKGLQPLQPSLHMAFQSFATTIMPGCQRRTLQSPGNVTRSNPAGSLQSSQIAGHSERSSQSSRITGSLRLAPWRSHGGTSQSHRGTREPWRY